eukprot:15359997-Ditylum_brightwellii.AAC.1
MNCALFKQNVQHFSQADGPSLTRKPIIDFEQYAELPLREAFCNGTLNIDRPNTDCYTKEFLKELQCQPSDPPCISTELGAKDIKVNYKNWKQCTSASPADQYLGLYKTWTHVPKEKEEEYNGLKPDEFFTMASTIMMICQKHNLALPR